MLNTMDTPYSNDVLGAHGDCMSDLVFDDIADIAHIFDTNDKENVSVSILRGVGGHSTRLDPYDTVCACHCYSVSRVYTMSRVIYRYPYPFTRLLKQCKHSSSVEPAKSPCWYGGKTGRFVWNRCI